MTGVPQQAAVFNRKLEGVHYPLNSKQRADKVEDELLDTVVHLVAEEVVETKAEQKEEVEKLIMNCFLSSLCVSKRLQVHYVNLRGEYMSVFC